MSIAFRNYGASPGANSASCVIVKPIGLALGDLMIAHVMSKIPVTAITPPANWNTVGSQIQTTGGRSGVFWKFAVQTDVDAVSFAFTVGTGGNRGGIAAYTGVDTATPIDVSNQQNNTVSDTSIETPLITPTTANTRICIFGGSDQEGTSSACSGTDPTCAEVWELVTTSGTDCGSHLWHGAKPVADQIDAHTITVSIAAVSAGHSVALREVQPPPSITGTGAVSGPPAAVAGTGKLSFLATAAIVAAAALLAATGSLGFKATGALSASPAAIAGTALQRFTGTGAVGGQPAQLAGEGTVQNPAPPPITGTGEFISFPAPLDAQGKLSFEATGDLTAIPVSLIGTGVERFMASGNLSGPPVQSAGQATLRFVGSAAVSGQPGALTGAGAEAFRGAASTTAFPASLSGTGSEMFKGSGDLLVEHAQLDGDGTVTTGVPGITGSGETTAPPGFLDGEGTVVFDGAVIIETNLISVNGTGIFGGFQIGGRSVA